MGMVAARLRRCVRRRRQTGAVTSDGVGGGGGLTIALHAGRDAVRAVPAALRLGPQRFRRHAWASAGRARIEVRGLDDGQTASSVVAALRRVRGVRLAEINAVTGHVLVMFDEGSVGMGTLVETVTSVEDVRNEGDEGWSRAEPPHPDDPAALTAAIVAVAADGAGLLAAMAGRLLVIRPVPTAARVLVGVVEAQPRLRRLVESGLGPAGTDAVLGVGAGILNGLTGGIAPQLVTGLSHALLLAEVRARRAVWRRRGDELEAAPGALTQHPPPKSPRPTPYPPGPVEVFADWVGAASLVVAGAVGAMTRDVGRTANLLLIGVPPAARLGREAFASTLARRLANQGVVPMDPGAFRRLDRITTVIVDDEVRSALQSAAGSAVDSAPWAERFERLAREIGLQVVICGVPEGESSSEQPRSGEQIRRLQAAGEAVLVVAAADNDVLAAADVAIAVPTADAGAGWAADLITESDPETVLTLLHAVVAARKVSRRAVVIAAAGTAAAAALTALNPFPTGDLTLQPVYFSGLLTQLDGVRAALTV